MNSDESLFLMVSKALEAVLTAEELNKVVIGQTDSDVIIYVYPTAQEFMDGCQLAWFILDAIGLHTQVRISAKARKQLNVPAGVLPPWIETNRSLYNRLQTDAAKLFGEVESE